MPKKTKSKLEKEQTTAWKYYDKWRKEGSYSPAFKEKIRITRYGWNHLIDPKKRRTSVQKVKRFKALSLARKIIETSTTYQEQRIFKGTSYYAFIAEIGGRRIKTVVSSRGKGVKIFLSVIVLR